MLWRLSQMQEENQTMNSSSDFGCDVCVVGKGLLGSATARHLAEMDLNVLLLGPDEPSVKSQHSGVFGSCLLYTSPSPRDGLLSRMPSSA